MLGPLLRLYRQAYSGLPRPVWMLCAVAFVNRCGMMVLPFLALYLTRELGRSRTEVGWILALWGAGGMVGSLAGGWAADRLGLIRTQALSLWGAGAGFLVLSQLRSLPALGAGLFVVAAVSDALRPANLAAVAAAAPPQVRTRALGLLRLAANAGLAVGPAVGGALALMSYLWLFVADAATSWAAAALLVAGMRGERRREAEERRAPRALAPTRSPLADGPFLLLLVLVFLLTLVLFQVWSTLPLYLRESYRLEEDRIGLLLALNTAVIVLVEMVLLRLVEGLSPTRVSAAGAFLLCGGFALMPLGGAFAWAAVTVVVWTFGEMLVLPFTNTLVAQRAGPGNLGRYMGLYMVAFSLSAAVAPVAGTAIWDRWGADALWWAAGALGVLLAVGFAALGPAFRVSGAEEAR